MLCLSKKFSTAPVSLERVSVPASGATNKPNAVPAMAPPRKAHK